MRLSNYYDFDISTSAGTSLDFVLTDLIVVTGMRNLLDLHLQLKRSFRRSNICILTIITILINLSNKGVLAILSKLKSLSFLKQSILQTKVWLENH